MVVGEVHDATRTDAVFRALADATRRDIVTRVLTREQSVSALARHYPMSLAAVQKHVIMLERAGLVTKHRSGREQLVRARVDELRRVHDVLDRLESLWRDRLGRLDGILLSGDDAHSPPPGAEHHREDDAP